MAQAVAAMAGLCSATQAVLQGSSASSLVSSNGSQLKSTQCGHGRTSARRGDIQVVCSQNKEDLEVHTRRSMLGLLAATVGAGALAREARAEATPVEIKPPPPPFGGLPGTDNADEARDVDLPLKERFFLQPLSPSEAVARAKESAEAIVGVKPLIEKKAWPYVQNELRNKAGYLRFDLTTIISSKPKEEKKALKSLVASLYASVDKLDYAARSKSQPNAEKYYAETVSKLDDVLSKL